MDFLNRKKLSALEARNTELLEEIIRIQKATLHKDETIISLQQDINVLSQIAQSEKAKREEVER